MDDDIDALTASGDASYRPQVEITPEQNPDVLKVHDDDDDDDDEDVCRICRNSGDAENPLRYPCACSGSIKYVHQECLLQWLAHSNARNCEVCKHAFSFSPVYAENAPARLPMQEFIIGMAMKACHLIQFFLRLAFVLSVWLVIIPFITFWFWKLTFVKSISEAKGLFLSHFSATLLLTDCIHGFLLSASIVFVFLGATSLRDYLRNLREMGAQDADREDDGHDRQIGRLGRRQQVAQNRALVAEGNDDDAGAGHLAGAGQMIRRNAENVAARLEMHAARLEAHVEQMFDGLDDADGADDVPFDELVGMQGPMIHLIENALTVLASNAIFLCGAFFCPFSIGRLIVYYISQLFSSSSLALSSLQPHEASSLIVNDTVNKNLSSLSSLSSVSGLPVGHIMGVVTDSLSANTTGLDLAGTPVVEHLKGTSSDASHLSDIAILLIGHVILLTVAVLYVGLLAFVRYTRGEPLSMGRLHGFVSLLEGIPSLARQFIGAMRHLMTMFKVASLLVIELGVFPLMCGWWLDVCTVRMLGATMSERREFLLLSPVKSSLLHWLLGIAYMLQISIFVSYLRGVLRNGVLYFLRDPADPQYNPFRDLIDDPVHKHARRVLLSVFVYGSLIVMLVFLPVNLSMRLAPSTFPLDISVSDPFMEIPTNFFLLRICMPIVNEHFKFKDTAKAVLRKWFTVVGWALGLTEFLLPRPEDDNGERNEGHRGVEAVEQQNAQIVGFASPEHQTESIDTQEESDSADQAAAQYGFVLRIVLLLVLAWIALLLFNSVLIVVPISVGRTLFNTVPRVPMAHGIKCNDLYAFSMGFFSLWAAFCGLKYAFLSIKGQKVRDLGAQLLKGVTIFFRGSFLLSIWFFVIPVLIGLLFELLLIAPIRVPVDESPLFILYQDWALGLISLQAWTQLVMLDHIVPLVDESWRMKFERVRVDGFSRLQGLWVLREILGPILMKLLTALCVPYVFAKGFFPLLGCPLIINSFVYRYSWLGCLILSTFLFCAKRFQVWFANLHNSIRDDRYLIGRRLHNFGEISRLGNNAAFIVDGQEENQGLISDREAVAVS